MFVWMCVYACTCTCAYMYVYIQTNMYAYTMHIPAHVCLCVHVCTSNCMCACLCWCVYRQGQMYKHTHINIHTQKKIQLHAHTHEHTLCACSCGCVYRYANIQTHHSNIYTNTKKQFDVHTWTQICFNLQWLLQPNIFYNYWSASHICCWGFLSTLSHKTQQIKRGQRDTWHEPLTSGLTTTFLLNWDTDFDSANPEYEPLSFRPYGQCFICLYLWDGVL